jgi:hypothetical protein
MRPPRPRDLPLPLREPLQGVITVTRDGESLPFERENGGDPAQDVDCTLALLLDQRFTVLDHLPDHKAPDDQSSSIVASVVVIGLGVAVTAGLIYGVATCEFEGCRAVFGVPLVLIGGGALFSLGHD